MTTVDGADQSSPSRQGLPSLATSKLRLPFSSPVGEDIVSLISTDQAPPASIYLNQRRPDMKNEYEPVLQSRAYSGRKQSSAQHNVENKQEKGTNKSRWPHALNVVTNFSKPPQLAQRAADAAQRKQSYGRGMSEKRHKRLNSSIDMKTPVEYKDRPGYKERLGQGINITDVDQAIGLGLDKFEHTRKVPNPPRDAKGPIDNLKRASSKLTNLSPSDRPIVIRISVPSDKLDQHSISPDVGPTPRGMSNGHIYRERRPSNAPTILVTPAKVKSPWSADSNSQPDIARRRAASSVYSRATNARGTPRAADIPPMPTAAGRSEPVSRGINPNRFSNARVVSAYTIFDDDRVLPGDTVGRRGSDDSQLRILKRSSTDSIATRRRSQGWWNHIVSPFLSRPGTFAWKTRVEPIEPVPSVPEQTPLPLTTNHAELSRRSLPISRRSSSSHTSIWTDTSPVEGDKRSSELQMLRSPFLEHARGLQNPDNDLADWFASLGAAAEYYHACWHDQNNPNPYFECQNHICTPRPIGNFVGSEGPNGTSKELSEDSEHSEEQLALQNPRHPIAPTPDGFQQVPTNRFEAAFAETVLPKDRQRERPLSQTTDIEDADATPEVHEAHAAPIVRAPAPVPAAIPPVPEPDARPGASREILATPPPPRNSSKQAPPAPDIPPPPSQSNVERPRDCFASPPPPAEPVPPTATPRKEEKPMKRFVAVMPPDHPFVTHENPLSLAAASPTGQTIGQAPSAMPLKQLSRPSADRDRRTQSVNTPEPQPNSYIINHYHQGFSSRPKSQQVRLADMEPPPKPEWHPEEIRLFREKEKHQLQETKPKRRACPPKLTGCLDRGKPKTKKQKIIVVGITAGLVALILLIVLLAMLLTRKGDNMQVQSQWLNLTGFPPIPTGISTIIQPDPKHEASGCIHPATLWSCAVPKEQQSAIGPNAPDQPNFRVEIRFQNGTISNGTVSNSTTLRRRSKAKVLNPVRAGSLIRNRLLHIRDFTSNLFIPSPSAPSREDQIFLGNTTDKNQQPFDGEPTPFFMSFITPNKIPLTRLVKRASDSGETNNTTNSTDPFPNLDSTIPAPSTNADGTASPAVLYPQPSAQPLRLYNRDTENEHYGFYTYFDRSIFLKSTALLNFTGTSPSEIPDDENGGAEENAAKVRCTWTQTRFLVQIWTRKGNSAPLLQSSNSSASSNADVNAHPKNITESSANNFTRPGSFPYPVSITLDRHGGDIHKKLLICYGMDQKEHFVSGEKQIQLEDRAFGGTLVNPALGPFTKVNVTGDEGGPGGIDGGTGGCGCVWENFGGGGS